MIPTPHRWRRVEIGEDVFLLPPSGTAVIRYRERLAPVLPVELLAAGQLADDPQFAIERIAPREDLVTLEGERATTIAVYGTLDTRRVQRHVGYVLAEDFYARVSSIADDADGDRMRVLVRSLVERIVLHLGPRRRRPVCVGPHGWRAHVVGLRTDWIAPAFPRDPSCITIWPAVPGPRPTGSPPVANADGTLGPWPLHTKRGLAGFTWRTAGAFADSSPRVRDHVLFADGRYRYSVRLDTEPARHEQRRAELLDVLDTLDPVPSIKRPPDSLSVSGHWAE
ncbi:MAG: hypothetical protein ACKV2T_03585 [Kofleriaceae bacterium]